MSYKYGFQNSDNTPKVTEKITLNKSNENENNA